MMSMIVMVMMAMHYGDVGDGDHDGDDDVLTLD